MIKMMKNLLILSIVKKTLINDEGPKEIELENTNSESNENIDNPKKNF